MKIVDIRKESLEQLRSLVAEKRRELVEMQIALNAGELQNPSTIRTTRRDIAAILTVIGEQKVAAAKKEEA